jgi:hypothetical protein
MWLSESMAASILAPVPANIVKSTIDTFSAKGRVALPSNLQASIDNESVVSEESQEKLLTMISVDGFHLVDARRGVVH